LSPLGETSVVTGSPVRCLTASRVRKPFLQAGPRNDLPDERFALSNDALNMSGNWSQSASSLSLSAMRSVMSCDSMTHGPRIQSNGLTWAAQRLADGDRLHRHGTLLGSSSLRHF